MYEYDQGVTVSVNSDSTKSILDCHPELSELQYNLPNPCYLSVLDRRRWHVVDLDLRTLQGGQFHSQRDYYGYSCQCVCVSVWKDNHSNAGNETLLILNKSFMRGLIDAGLYNQRVYRIRFKYVSQRQYHIKELKLV